jgi:hypothetical protein
MRYADSEMRIGRSLIAPFGVRSWGWSTPLGCHHHRNYIGMRKHRRPRQRRPSQRRRSCGHVFLASSQIILVGVAFGVFVTSIQPLSSDPEVGGDFNGVL